MITTLEIEQTYEKAVAELPFFHQIAYAYCIAKRLFPYYFLFSEKESFGDPKLLLKGLELIKKIALTEQILHEEIKKLLPDLEAIIPDTEEFGGLHTSLALDASVAVYESLSAVLENDIPRLSTLAFIPFGLAEMQIQVKNLDNEDLMLAEIRFQDELLAQLRRARNLGDVLE
jgi:uncharacterized protein YjaG (DUF416 family)